MTTIAVDLADLKTVERRITDTGDELTQLVAAVRRDVLHLAELRMTLTNPATSAITKPLGVVSSNCDLLAKDPRYVQAHYRVRDDLAKLRHDLDEASKVKRSVLTGLPIQPIYGKDGKNGGLYGSAWRAIKRYAGKGRKALAIAGPKAKRHVRAEWNRIFTRGKKLWRPVKPAAQRGYRLADRLAHRYRAISPVGTPIGPLKPLPVGFKPFASPGEWLYKLHNIAFVGDARRVGARTTRRNPKSLAGYLEMIPKTPERCTIAKVDNGSGTPAYVVIVRGMELKSVGVNGAVEAGASVLTGNDPYTQALKQAMLTEIPPGANVMLIGHSQGGAAVANLAADPSLNGRRFTVTHVVTAGSPSEGKQIPASTRVLRVENHDDFVPDLDGYRPTRGQKYEFTEGSSDDHAAKTYATEMKSKGFLTSGQYQEFAAGTDKYYSGKTVGVSTYRLTLKTRLFGLEA